MAVIKNVLEKLEVPSCNCVRCRQAMPAGADDDGDGGSSPAPLPSPPPASISEQLDQMRSMITSLQASRHVVLSCLCCMIIMSCLRGCVFNSI